MGTLITVLWEFEAMGTVWSIEIETARPDISSLEKKVKDRIALFDVTYSRFRQDSQVMKWSQPGIYPLPKDAIPLLSFYKQLYALTGGRVTPLIGQLMSDAGYDAQYSFIEKTRQASPVWDEVLEYDDHQLTVKQPNVLDFGAAGKGYLIDLVTKIITNDNLSQSILIDAGGDIRHWQRIQNSDEALVIGLENPSDFSQVIATANLQNGSICASAGSRRQWGGGHHIIDPILLRSPSQIVATWVMADSAMVADGLATALFFVKPEELASAFQFSYAVLDQHNSLSYSPRFLQEVFTS